MYLGEATFPHSNGDKIIDAAKDLQMEQLAKCFANVNSNILEILQDNDEYANDTKNDTKSISSTVDYILNLEIKSYNFGSDELVSSKPMFKCEECETVFKGQGARPKKIK